jgi:hypothetical protein
MKDRPFWILDRPAAVDHGVGRLRHFFPVFKSVKDCPNDGLETNDWLTDRLTCLKRVKDRRPFCFERRFLASVSPWLGPPVVAFAELVGQVHREMKDRPEIGTDGNE